MGITDGDTITVLNSKTLKDAKIRLYGIDNPEKEQSSSKKGKAVHFQDGLREGGRGEGDSYFLLDRLFGS